jgi:glycosyltransferase involved in cell wall biosynthesis
MQSRLGFQADRLYVVPNGISVDGYQRSKLPDAPAVLGYFARMCEAKGLPLLVDAYIELKKLPNYQAMKLMVGGGMGPSDEPVVEALKTKLNQAGCLDDVTWRPNLDREEKLEFFSKLTVFSVPALYGETYGLYLLEAMAAGVPVIQPPHAAFPEIIEATGGGVLTAGLSKDDLAESIDSLLKDKTRLKQTADAAIQSVNQSHQSIHMAKRVLEVYQSVLDV